MKVADELKWSTMNKKQSLEEKKFHTEPRLICQQKRNDEFIFDWQMSGQVRCLTLRPLNSMQILYVYSAQYSPALVKNIFSTSLCFLTLFLDTKNDLTEMWRSVCKLFSFSISIVIKNRCFHLSPQSRVKRRDKEQRLYQHIGTYPLLALPSSFLFPLTSLIT